MAASGSAGKNTDSSADSGPADLLVDLLLYAPVGLIYEYEEVLPRLVRRGKSQVQLAQAFGKMALSGSPSPASADVASLVSGWAAKRLAQAITDLGASVGLAPTDHEPGPPDEDNGATDPPGAHEPSPPQAPAPPKASRKPMRLPIAGYDRLTAREIIGLLDELDSGQLERIRAHEVAHRARKTVLSKLDRMLQGSSDTEV